MPIFKISMRLLKPWEKNLPQQDFAGKLVLSVVYRNPEDDVSFERIRNKTFSFIGSDQFEPVLFGLTDDGKSLYREVHTIDISDFLEKYYGSYFTVSEPIL